MITAAQSRAARGLLAWTQEELARRSSVGLNTIRKFEGGKTNPRNSTLLVLQATFEKEGVHFTDEGSGGVWLRG